MNRPTYSDVLSIRYPGPARWSPSGQYISFVEEDAEYSRLRVYDFANECYVPLSSEVHGQVSSYRWHPRNDMLILVDGGNIYEARGGNLWFADVTKGQPGGPSACRPLTRTRTKEQSVNWHPKLDRIAFARDGELWVMDIDTGYTRQYEMPGPFYRDRQPPGIAWDREGARIAHTFLDERGRRRLAVLDADSGECLWRSEGTMPQDYAHWHPVWLAGGLTFQRSNRDSTVRDVIWVDPDTGDQDLVYRLDDPEGIPFLIGPVASPGKDKAVFLLSDDGWEHLYLWEPRRGMRQLTEGRCEDFGHASDRPVWLPDGKSLIFASNRDRPEERQLWKVDITDCALERLTHDQGSACWPALSRDGHYLAYLHADRERIADVCVLDLESGSQRRVTDETPSVLSNACVIPQRQVFRGSTGLNSYGFMLEPPSWEAGEPAPALIFVHGGPIRQMRDGFHPSSGYSFFYGIQQVLAHRGVVGMVVNYPAGIGYGREFNRGTHLRMGQADLEGVVEAARWLSQQPFVDSSRIGVWGISYGGFLTLHAVAQHPELFDLGINIAGVWDNLLNMNWRDEVYPGQVSYHRARLGRGDQAVLSSPKGHWTDIRRPMLHLQGTDDEAVPIETMSLIIEASVRDGAVFESQTYPNEVHRFRRRETWVDAFRRVDDWLERHWGVPRD